MSFISLKREFKSDIVDIEQMSHGVSWESRILEVSLCTCNKSLITHNLSLAVPFVWTEHKSGPLCINTNTRRVNNSVHKDISE